MAYREVTMVDVKEVLRLWMEGVPRKRIAAQLGLDPKTVRRYVRTATRAGLGPRVASETDESLGTRWSSPQPRGARWCCPS